MRSSPNGFTLIELLVALAILAVVATVGFRGMGSILEADRHVQTETRRWNDLALVFANLARDLSMAVARPVRDAAGRTRAGLLIDRVQDDSQEQFVITRLGDDEDTSSRGMLRRVGYRLRARNLDYLVWPAPDLAPGIPPVVSPLLENVSAFQLRALDANGAWTSLWPGDSSAEALPRAVEVQIVLGTGARVTRIFALR